MAWIYEALEVHDRRGRPMGKFRVVRWTPAAPEDFYGLCDHHHATPVEALNCPVANQILEEEFSDLPRIKQPRTN